MVVFRSLFVAFSLVMFVFANNVVASENHAESEKVKQYVTKLSDDVLGVIAQKGISDAAKEAKLKEIFVASVDSKWMGKFVLGKYRRTATDEQIGKYMPLYNDYLIYTYIPKFRQYSGETYEILRVKRNDDGEFVVNIELKGVDDNPDLRVDYRLIKNSKGEYKLIDIVGEGISLITTQRSDFGGLISKKGLDYFIGKLEKKVKKLSSGEAADKSTATKQAKS